MIDGKAILDYEPQQPVSAGNQLLDDKKFREDQRKDKQVYANAMAKDKEEEKKSFTDKIADRIAPEPVKPTSALEKKLQ